MGKKAIVLNAKDNVATALADLAVGEAVEVEIEKRTIPITLSNPISFGHKFSIAPIKSGSAVIKYGEVIGQATADIQPGQHVHIHNVASTRGRGDIAQGAKK